jgi:hypothetical protein
LREAKEVYLAELSKWNLLPDQEIIAKSKETADLSLVTLLESQLARSLKKDTPVDRKNGCEKYMNLYANVSRSQIQPALLLEAQRLAAAPASATAVLAVKITKK